jgi:prevent-host-death family protein
MDLVHDLVHNKAIMEVNVHEAKTNFSKLLQRVILGDEVIIAKAGVPVAKLVRYVTKKGKRPLGFYRGQIWMADDFDAPLPDDILAGFYGEDVPDRKPVKRAPAKKRKKA